MEAELQNKLEVEHDDCSFATTADRGRGAELAAMAQVPETECMRL